MTGASPSARPGSAFAVCVAGAAVPVLDITKVYVVAPIMGRELDASPLAIQLAVAGYVVVFGLALIPAGRYGDLHSRRRMFLVGVVLFALTSLAVGLAVDQWTLVAARLLQGAAAALILPQALGIIQQLYAGSERARALGVFGASHGLATAVAPGLAGLIVGALGDELGWRASFLLNVPIAIAVFVVAFRVLPSDPTTVRGPRDFDPIGVILLGATVSVALTPFVLTGGPADDARRWWLLAALPFLVAAFLGWERRYAASGRVPVVDLRLFGIRSFRSAVLITLFYFGSIPALVFLSATFLQLGLGRTPLETGLVTIAPAAAYALSSFAAGRLGRRLGRGVGVVSLTIFGVGVLLAALVAAFGAVEAIPWLLIAPLFVAGIGAGAFGPVNQILALADVPAAQGGLAGSIQQVAQRFGTAIGLAVVIAIFASLLASGQAGGAVTAARHAFAGSVAVCFGFIAVTLLLVILDLVHRRREPPPEPLHTAAP